MYRLHEASSQTPAALMASNHRLLHPLSECGDQPTSHLSHAFRGRVPMVLPERAHAALDESAERYCHTWIACRLEAEVSVTRLTLQMQMEKYQGPSAAT